MPGSSLSACPLRTRVDPRLVRFSAGATAGVLAVVLLIVDVARPLSLGLLASQVAVFAFTAFFGFGFTALALIFFVVGVDVAGYSLTALAFGVAALNAATGLCLGCKAYLLTRSARDAGRPETT